MYIPRHFAGTDEHEAFHLMQAYPFGMAITVEAGEPFVSHVPFLIDAHARVLRWHLAAANPQCDHLARGANVRLIFHGPHAYVSPRWYEAPNVPTWNYIAVHVDGEVTPLEDEDTAAVVAALSRQYEGEEGLGEFVDTATYRNLLTAIRGFRLSITRIHAKYKLSQNRAARDRANVAAHLAKSDDSAVRAIAAYMSRLNQAGL